MFVKSTRFKQVCQLLLSLIVAPAFFFSAANGSQNKLTRGVLLPH